MSKFTKKILHTFKPSLCLENAKWKNDKFICKDCGNVVGFKLKSPDGKELSYIIDRSGKLHSLMNIKRD